MARFDFIACYILANRKQGTLYTGVTSDLLSRMEQHKLGKGSAFAAQHQCNLLVWYERFETMPPALARERTIKGWSRQWKINLIEEHNRFWTDLSGQISEYGW
jgi:putative endonuclease